MARVIQRVLTGEFVPIFRTVAKIGLNRDIEDIGGRWE